MTKPPQPMARRRGRNAKAVFLRLSEVSDQDAAFLSGFWGISRREVVERALIICRAQLSSPMLDILEKERLQQAAMDYAAARNQRWI